MFKKIISIIRKLKHNNRGQSSTEYMLIIAVVVLGLVAAASKLIPMFSSGVQKLGANVVQTLETNQKMSGVDN